MDQQASYVNNLAVRCGLIYRASSSSAQGVWNGRQVFVEALRGGLGVRIQVAVNLPESFALVPETAFTLLRKWLSHDMEIGDEIFDPRFLVNGGDADVAAVLNEDARFELLDLLQHKDIVVKDNKLVIVTRGQVIKDSFGAPVWMPLNVGEIQELIDKVHRVAECLSTSDRPREARLLDNVRNDSDPEVRARNMAMLALYHHDSNELSDALEAVLGSLDEDALIAGLAKSEPLDRQVAAAIALGRSGSGRGVPHLREWLTTVDKEYDYARRVGHQSVAAIQKRAGPVEGGALSLTEAASGALSEAEGQGGELSVAEEEERRKKLAAAKGKTVQG